MSKLLDRLTLTALCLLGGVLAVVFIAKGWYRVDVPVVRAQSNPTAGMRTVIVNKTQRLDPLEVVRVLEGGTEVAPSAPSQDNLHWLVRDDLPVRTTKEFRAAYNIFDNDDTWLQNLSLVLRNRTSKSIAFLWVGVGFPETKATGPVVWPYMRFGQLPANVAFYGSGRPIPAQTEDLFLLAPGEEMSFSFVGHAVHLKGAVESRQPFSTVSMCYLHFKVSFDDGMQWSEGGYADPDPAHPGRFIPTDTGYFPGPLVAPPVD